MMNTAAPSLDRLVHVTIGGDLEVAEAAQSGPPAPPSITYELREDGGFELREDGGIEERESGN